jgi:hypothetical protein
VATVANRTEVLQMNLLLKRSGQMFASSATVGNRTEVLRVSVLLLPATRRNDRSQREEREVSWGKVGYLVNEVLHKRSREERKNTGVLPRPLYTESHIPGPSFGPVKHLPQSSKGADNTSKRIKKCLGQH